MDARQTRSTAGRVMDTISRNRSTPLLLFSRSRSLGTRLVIYANKFSVKWSMPIAPRSGVDDRSPAAETNRQVQAANSSIVVVPLGDRLQDTAAEQSRAARSRRTPATTCNYAINARQVDRSDVWCRDSRLLPAVSAYISVVGGLRCLRLPLSLVGRVLDAN